MPSPVFTTDPTHVPTVAIVDDEEDLSMNICLFLQAAGFEVWTANSAEHFYRQFANKKADVVIVDIGLPGEDGLSLIANLQEGNRGLGIIALTARGNVADRIAGLEAGADSYLVKPVDLYELAASIHAVLRRLDLLESSNDATATARESGISPAQWVLSQTSRQLCTPEGSSLHLTSREFALLDCLMHQPEALVKKSTLIMLFEADDEAQPSTDFHPVESILSRLRKKMLAETGLSLPVRSVFGKGLVFMGRCRFAP